MRDKHLTEAGWRTLSGKYPAIHDNGLLKALNIYEHLGDSGDPDARLRALVQIGDFASKLRKIHEVAAIHEVAVYLDDLGKEDGKARVVVAAGKREAAKSKAEEQKADADGKKLTKAIGAELVAGLQKSKTIECPALVCVASPICGLMVATNITSQHKVQLTQFTRSTKFLPLGSCIWDEATHAYTFIMQRRESGLLLQLQQAIKCLTAMSVKVIVMTRVEYDAKQTAETEKDGAGAEFDPTENAPDDPHPSGVEDEPESQSTSMKSFALGASVGANGKNNKADVKEVQAALNREGAQLDEDGICGAKTIGAIRDFQKLMGFTHPDGLVEPNGFTHRGLRGEDVKLPQLQKRPNPPKAGTSKPPGGSQSSDDYKEGFQDGFSGDDSHPGPRDGGALIEYNEGYAKGHNEFREQSPSGGSSATSNEADRIAALEREYTGWLAEGNWPLAAEALNGFNRAEINKKLAALEPDQVVNMQQGAIDNPRVGPQAQVVQLCREKLSGDNPDFEVPETAEQQVEHILHGSDKIVSLAEAANWVIKIEALHKVLPPIAAAITIVDTVMGLWDALNVERSMLGYQGYAYGLLRSCAGMSDPTPNPGWPDARDVENDYTTFYEGIARAKEHAKDVTRSNHILLSMAKYGPRSVLKDVWDRIISGNDDILKNYTPRWPDVAPG